MARRRRPAKGRTLVALGLLGFLLVTSFVVWRRSRGHATAQALRQLDNERRALLSERTTLERDLREAMSGPRVISAAQQRLGLRVAGELQLRSIVIRPGVLPDSGDVP